MWPFKKKNSTKLLDIKIIDLIDLLQTTLDNITKVHLGKPRQLFVEICKDVPYKFELIVFNSDKVIISFTLEEILEVFNLSPRHFFESIEDKYRAALIGSSRNIK